MKRIIGISLAVLLAFAAIWGVRPHEAEAQAVDCRASDLSQYDALVCYFQGEIGKPRLEQVLPNPDGDPGSPAVAGTTGTLISNTGQTAAGLTANAWTDRDFVQEFTTGSLTAPSVWRVSSVDVELTFAVQTVATLPTIQVQIYASSGGKPTGNALGTLTPMHTVLSGSNTYQTTTAVQLNPGTSYVVVVDVSATSSNAGSDVRIVYTGSDDEDSGGATGWSIGGTAFSGDFNTPGTYTSPNNSQPIKIAISGQEYTPAVPPSPPPPAFTQTLKQLSEAGANVAQSTYECGGKPNPKLEAFYRDPLGTNWNTGETLYCDLSTGEWVSGRTPQAGVDYGGPDDLIAPGEAGYNASCYYTNANGDRTPLARSVTNPDGSWARNSDGSRIFIIIEGANWDPIAQQCTGRPS